MDESQNSGPRRFWGSALVLKSLVVLGIALVTGTIAYTFGTHNAGVSVLSGSAHSVPDQIGAQSGGVAYAVPLDVSWLGPHGDWHSGSRPSCLPPTGEIEHVKFGVVPFTFQGGPQFVVVWVSCAG